MEKLMLLLLFPLAWPFIAKRIWDTEITYQEMFLNIIIVVITTTVVWELGKYNQTADVEIWNGEIVSKDRHHGHYIHTYSCNCTESCSGSGSNEICIETCQTCYEDHYTVTWVANTTVGKVQFDHKDSTSRSVYNSQNPTAYTRCKVGEPAAIEHGYTNYVQAVPQSLFHNTSEVALDYKKSIPAYPRVFDFYHIDRILKVGVDLSKETQDALNDGLNNALITLGPAKEVNIILLFTSIQDASYRYAVENAWLGGEKNDVIIFLGVDDAKKILWVDVMTWALNSGNELFQVKMRDGLKKIGTVDVEKIVSFVPQTILQYYDRPHMRDFEYLKDAVEPQLWVIIFAVVISTIGSMGLTILFNRYEIDLFRNI